MWYLVKSIRLFFPLCWCRFLLLLKWTDASLQRTGSPGREPAAMANREAAICFSFWPRGEASMTATLSSPVTQLRPVFVSCQKDECFELWTHTKKTQNPGVNCSLRAGRSEGGRFGWFGRSVRLTESLRFTAEAFPARLRCAKCNSWTLFGLQRFIKEKRGKEESDLCFDC